MPKKKGYIGFNKLMDKLTSQHPGYSEERKKAIAASIGRKKYGSKKFQAAAAKGKKLG